MRTAPPELQYRTSWICGVPMANTGWTSALFGTALTYPGCMSQRKRNGASQKMLFNSMILITVGMTSLYYCYYNIIYIYIYYINIYCQCIAITLVYWHDNISFTAKKTHRQKTSENHQTHIRLGSDRTIEQRSLAEFFIPTSPSIPGPNPRVLPRYHTTTAPQPKAEIGHTTVMTVGSRTRAFWEFYRINWPWECMEVLKWRLVDTDLKWRLTSWPNFCRWYGQPGTMWNSGKVYLRGFSCGRWTKWLTQDGPLSTHSQPAFSLDMKLFVLSCERIEHYIYHHWRFYVSILR
jgi:hypothetical protein